MNVSFYIYDIEGCEDEHSRDFADGTWGCLKRLKTIQKDREDDFKAQHPEYYI